MRASVVAEKVGIPTVSIILTGFLGQARAIAQAQGMENLPVAEYPGVVMTDSKEDLQKKVESVLVNNIIGGFTTPIKATIKPAEPQPRDVIFDGTLDEVHEFFYKNLWTDGLPIVPPTMGKVELFLKFTDRSPDEVLGILQPENREATVWNIAVNGVMAGCRPEYMPILIAIVEAIAAPEFRIQDAGSTPGWEPLIILNGPIIKELDFNYETGVMRVGRQANTSIGRFLRLYMRNIAGLRIPPGSTDKATTGCTFNVVLAENEDAVAEVGWQPFSVDRGFQRGENLVTVQSVVYTTPPVCSGGDNVSDHLETLAEVIGTTMAYWTFVALNWGKFYPLLVISPSVAGAIAKDGGTKDDIRRYLQEKAKVSPRILEKLAWQRGLSNFNLCALVNEGVIPKQYCESTDPDRMVPVFPRAEWIGIVVSGTPGRNENKGYAQNHEQGVPVSRKIILPANWKQLLSAKK